jgi:hypothetical protein
MTARALWRILLIVVLGCDTEGVCGEVVKFSGFPM